MTSNIPRGDAQPRIMSKARPAMEGVREKQLFTAPNLFIFR